jgi:hypothetical protein
VAAEVVDRETGEITPAEERNQLGEGWADARLNPRFIQLRQGKPFASYPGLLDLMHQLSEGYFSIETDIVQLPTAENGHTAVVQARVRVFDPQDADVVRRLTTGIGDACPENVSSQMRPHLLRMAETRAKARALRDAVNVGMAALEELGPDEASPAAPERRVEQVYEPVERIMIEGKAWTRPQVEDFYRKRVEQAKAAGLALGQAGQPGGDVVPLERTPLAVLAGRAQELRRRLEARGAGEEATRAAAAPR